MDAKVTARDLTLCRWRLKFFCEKLARRRDGFCEVVLEVSALDPG